LQCSSRFGMKTIDGITGYSFLHAKFRIWTNRLNLCLNLRPQWGHAWRGSCPHSILMCRRNEWYSWYTLQHLGHTNKLLSCCAVSVMCAVWFWLDKMGAKAPISVPHLYFPSSSTETAKKKDVSTILSSVTWHFQDVKSIKIVFIWVEVITVVTMKNTVFFLTCNSVWFRVRTTVWMNKTPTCAGLLLGVHLYSEDAYVPWNFGLLQTTECHNPEECTLSTLQFRCSFILCMNILLTDLTHSRGTSRLHVKLCSW
jgi:hypothetical protein